VVLKLKMNTRYLVIHDVDAIQQYVFTTDRLRDLRGASALIDKINREDTTTLARRYGEAPIYVGGGGAAADFSTQEAAESFCREVASCYVDQTMTASSTGVVVSYDDSVQPEDENSFRDALMKAHRELRNQKASRRRKTQLLTNSYFKRCQACGIYPVSRYDPHLPGTEEDGRFICRSCSIKRTYGARRQALQSQVHQQLVATYRSEYGRQIQFPDDLDGIGNAGSPSGYIGVMYADGNRMGDRLGQIESKSALESFSSTIDKATQNTIASILVNRLHQLTHNSIFPALVPLCGGDDLVVIAPANQILEIAVGFLESFQDSVKQEMDDEVAEMLCSREISACAGVVIAKSHTPLKAMIYSAHELCKSAKRRSYDVYQQYQGKPEPCEVPCVDFQVITTPSWGKVSETRQRVLTPTQNQRLTCRPYTVDEVKQLMNAANALKQAKFPPGKLHDLYRSLWRGKNHATLHYFMLVARARGGEGMRNQKQALHDVEQHLGMQPQSVMPPWREWEGRPMAIETPYADLVEIYPFINEERTNA
jgi:hypothetical protein